jgi:cell division transport system permease protein
MIFRSIGHAIKQAFKQTFRNRAMSFASLFSITAMLLLLGLFFILVVNVNMIAESAKKQFDTIQIYLLDTTEYAAAETIMTTLSKNDHVASADYLSKEEAMKEYKLKWGDKSYLLDGLSENPLPNSIRIKLSDVSYASEVVESAKALEGIEDIKYYQTAVDKLIEITEFIKIGALIIILSLMAVSVVVVSNTVKLTVLAREKEIGIMKYVGATNWYIRGPFLVEGILIGFLSAAVAVGLTGALYFKITELVGQELFLMFSTAMVPERFLIVNLIYIFMALGISIGAFGSIVSMRRFLDT